MVQAAKVDATFLPSLSAADWRRAREALDSIEPAHMLASAGRMDDYPDEDSYPLPKTDPMDPLNQVWSRGWQIHKWPDLSIPVKGV